MVAVSNIFISQILTLGLTKVSVPLLSSMSASLVLKGKGSGFESQDGRFDILFALLEAPYNTILFFLLDATLLGLSLP
jgi:hypothetical protein